MLGTAIALTAAALAAFGTQAASTPPEGGAMSRKQIEQIVHEYILAHPEILPEAMERLNANRIGAVIAQHRKQIETPYGGAWEGAANGDVVLVEFFDYACGYCRASLPEIARLVAEDKRIKVVYRELPILSPLSAEAAKVSLLAARKGNYMAYHRALYDAGRVSRDTIFAAAQSAGIDRKAAESAIVDKSYDSEIENNISLAQKLQASGTPTFVIGDKMHAGAVGYDALKDAVAEARARAAAR